MQGRSDLKDDYYKFLLNPKSIISNAKLEETKNSDKGREG